MFKIIYRTLIVLIAAGLVSAGLYWFAGSSSGQTALTGAGGGLHEQATFSPPNGSSGTQAAQPNFQERGDHEEGGASLSQALPEILKNIATIAGITAAIAGLRKLLTLIPRLRRAAPLAQP